MFLRWRAGLPHETRNDAREIKGIELWGGGRLSKRKPALLDADNPLRLPKRTSWTMSSFSDTCRIGEALEHFRAQLTGNRPRQARPARCKLLKVLQRETGIEPATSSLGSRIRRHNRLKMCRNFKYSALFPILESWTALGRIGPLLIRVGHNRGHSQSSSLAGC